ncbi:hypothetical protein DF186_20635, partial [Enterococcus hirae]
GLDQLLHRGPQDVSDRGGQARVGVLETLSELMDGRLVMGHRALSLCVKAVETCTVARLCPGGLGGPAPTPRGGTHPTTDVVLS